MMALCKISLTRVVVGLALVYLSYNFYAVYSIFYPPFCVSKQKNDCIKPAYTVDTELQVCWQRSSKH